MKHNHDRTIPSVLLCLGIASILGFGCGILLFASYCFNPDVDVPCDNGGLVFSLIVATVGSLLLCGVPLLVLAVAFGMTTADIGSIEHFLNRMWFRALAGSTIGTLVGILNGVIVERSFTPSVAFLVTSPCSGIIASAVQGAFLRRYMRPSPLWIIVAGIAWLGMQVATAHLASLWSPYQHWSLDIWGGVGLIGGLIIGASQWLIIRHYLQQAWLWIVVQTLIWAGVWMVVFVIVTPPVAKHVWWITNLARYWAFGS